MIVNYLLAALYTACAVYFAVMLVFAFKQRVKIPLMSGLCMILLSLFALSAARIAFHLVPQREGLEWLAILLRTLDTPARMASIMASFFYILTFYKYTGFKKPTIIITIMALPFASLIWAALTPFYNVLRSGPAIHFNPNSMSGELTPFTLLIIGWMAACGIILDERKAS